jgi:hypothetical protein
MRRVDIFVKNGYVFFLYKMNVKDYSAQKSVPASLQCTRNITDALKAQDEKAFYKNLTGRAKLAFDIFGLEYYLNLFAYFIGGDLRISTFFRNDTGAYLDGEFRTLEDSPEKELLALSGIRLKKSGKGYKLEHIYHKPIDEQGHVLQEILDFHDPEKREEDFFSEWNSQLREFDEFVLWGLWSDNSFALSEVISGYKIWKDIIGKINIRNIPVFIAAIQSILGQLRMQLPHYTHYAKQNDCSPSTVSAKVKEIIHVLKIRMCDPRYTNDDPLPMMKGLGIPKPLLGNRPRF